MTRSTYEVNADGRDVGLGVGIIGEPQEQTGLSDTGVTDKQKLEEVVVSVKEMFSERRVSPVELGEKGAWRLVRLPDIRWKSLC